MSNKNTAEYVLSADIGGTNSRFAVCSVSSSNKIRILRKIQFPTKQTNIYETIEGIIRNEKKNITKIAIGAAGILMKRKIKLTNAPLTIDADKLENKLKRPVYLINDFIASGFFVNLYTKKRNETCAVIGPGTGLGKCILVWHSDHYVPVASEGGHTLLPLKINEQKLYDFIKKKSHSPDPIWEDVISGRGLENLHEFRTAKNMPALKIKDKKTFMLLGKYFARCIRNFALECLASEVFVIGSLSRNHPEIFTTQFKKELMKGDYPKFLKRLKVTVVKEKDCGLIGAAYATTKLRR